MVVLVLVPAVILSFVHDNADADDDADDNFLLETVSQIYHPWALHQQNFHAPMIRKEIH